MKKITGFLLLSAAAFTFSRVHAQDQITTTTTTTTTVTTVTAPPELPVYEQPACPVDGYLWVPGYWAWDAGNGYYWVPGVWVAPPESGLLWTPAYWGYAGGVYGFHDGYWGAEIGYYGGINYGYGYGGVGFVGGAWDGGNFRYNTAVLNVNATVVHNTYVDRTVITDAHNRSSFNGHGGVDSKPTSAELKAMNEKHVPATADQASHRQAASQDRNQYASMNRGHPASAAMKTVGGAAVKTQPHVADNSTKGNDHPGTSSILADKKPATTNDAANKPMNANDIALANRAKQKAAGVNTSAETNTTKGGMAARSSNANTAVNRSNNNAVNSSGGQNSTTRRPVSTNSHPVNAQRQPIIRNQAPAPQQTSKVQQAPKPQQNVSVAQAPRVQPSTNKRKP